MVLLDDQRRHVEINGAYLALLGYPRSALIGHPAYEFIEDGPRLTKSQWAELLSQKQFSGVVGLVSQDRNIIKVEFAGHPEVVTGQQLVLVVALKTVRGLRRIHPERLPTEMDTPLTKRELEIVEMVAMGLTSSEIATELHVSHNTVRTHVRNAMSKLEARSRAHLVAKSLAEPRHLRSSA
jgi:DNA-binding NarL/FixJ family response regulator